MNSPSVSSENKERTLELLTDFPNTQTAYTLRKQSNSLEKLKSLMTSEKKKRFLSYLTKDYVIFKWIFNIPEGGNKTNIVSGFLKYQQRQYRQLQHREPDVHSGMAGFDY